MDTAAQDDSTLVEAVRRGERAGLEGMYRRYADRLYTYARTMLREPEAAADAVHDAFLTASQRIDQLREPDRLRSWLYAIVRNECLRQLRERSRSLPLEEAGEPAADIADPGTGVNADQVRDLVHSAVAALNPGDREVVHLAIRHDLSSADIGAALGVPTNHAHARLSRARAQLERALGALLVARTGARDCPGLADLIDGWQGRLTPTLRKRVSRHIESCAVCGLLRREQLSPAALLSAYTAPAFLVVADSVWPRLAEAPTGAPADPVPGAGTDPAGPVTADPAPADPALSADPAPPPGPVPDPAPPAEALPGMGDTGQAQGAAEGTPADGAADGPTPAANGPVTPDGAAAGPSGGVTAVSSAGVAASSNDVAAAPGGAVASRGAAHPVRTTSPANRKRHRRQLAASVALLILLAALGTWALAPGRPTAAQDAAGQPVSETRGPAAGGPVTPASASPSGTAPVTGTRAAEPPPAGAVGPTPGPVVTPGDGDGVTRTDAPDAVPGGPAPAPTTAPTRPPAVPRPTVTPKVAAPFTVSATAHVRCGSDTYTLVVQATGSAALGGAEVRWTPAGGRTSTRAMTVDGTTARASVGRLRAPTLTWSVRATAGDGRTAGSPTYTVTDPCVRPG
ncbi:sigma-70 family RNA polymerase sigma factor [Micromonospora sp. DSM 115977]|uniref:Sigma-70 family RNA polymerase sigma factor n=1 Tax=Micromonospora reichwaldensis TaxID=3075516 RepID=A0ABU2WVF5_9ACTN|nr:sigma-70 family RNA polymerase sigma factor [Micromonospora sp. DSM 115977]MDT0529862.1 sigma-70 family RNA polymerase sigma factor [Micromonospora sp. DSM 115977]